MAEAGEGDVPLFDYRVITDEREYTREDVAAIPVGDVVQSNENVYRALPDDDWWTKGDLIGKAYFEERDTTDEGVTLFTATFVIGGDSTQVRGLIPGNGSWVGQGRAWLERGTGKFKDRRPKEIPVVGRNPKRWG